MDVLLTIPDGTRLDGAVVELAVVPDAEPFYVTAEVRIPAPADQQ